MGRIDEFESAVLSLVVGGVSPRRAYDRVAVATGWSPAWPYADAFYQGTKTRSMFNAWRSVRYAVYSPRHLKRGAWDGFFLGRECVRLRAAGLGVVRR